VGVGPEFVHEREIGVYSVGSQARAFFPPEISGLPPNLGHDYEQNGFGEKRGRVGWNRLSGRKMGERYGARKAEIGRAFQKEQERAGVKRSGIMGVYRCRPYRVDIWRNHQHRHMFDICKSFQSTLTFFCHFLIFFVLGIIFGCLTFTFFDIFCLGHYLRVLDIDIFVIYVRHFHRHLQGTLSTCDIDICRHLNRHLYTPLSEISRGFQKQRIDRGTSGRVLGCLTVRASRNSIFIQQSHLVLPSPLPVPFLIALAYPCAVVSLLMWAALLQGAFSQTKTHMHGENVRHKVASREGRASSVVAPRPLSGSPCLREMGRMA